MINVFILAAGSATRCNGEIKQLFQVGGESIIRRTIRLIRKLDSSARIHIITWRNELKFPDVEIIDTKSKPNQLSDSILLSVDKWGERNIFLLGDVIFGEGVIKEILDYKGDPAIFYRERCPLFARSEIFGLSFANVDSKSITHLLEKSSRIWGNTNHADHGGLGKVCYSTHPEWLLWLIAPLTFNVRNPLWMKIVRPFRDYFIYHIWNFWKPSGILKLVSINDGITTDIDTLEDYRNFLAHEVSIYGR